MYHRPEFKPKEDKEDSLLYQTVIKILWQLNDILSVRFYIFIFVMCFWFAGEPDLHSYIIEWFKK